MSDQYYGSGWGVVGVVLPCHRVPQNLLSFATVDNLILNGSSQIPYEKKTSELVQACVVSHWMAKNSTKVSSAPNPRANQCL